MKRWDDKKNKKLKEERGLGFEDLLALGDLIDIIAHPKKEGQELWIIKYENACWVVVYEAMRGRFVTLYKSSKMKKRYL